MGSLERSLKESLAFMPKHRSQSKRGRLLALDQLIDDYRQFEKLQSGSLDFILMGYRFVHLFRREKKKFLRAGKLKPPLLEDLWLLAFAALLSRDRTPPSAIVSSSVDLARKLFGEFSVKVSNAFFRQISRKKQELLAELSDSPEILLGPGLQKRWSTHPEILARSARQVLERPLPGIGGFDENFEYQQRELKGVETFERFQPMDSGSYLFMRKLREEFMTEDSRQTLLDACSAPGGKLIALHKIKSHESQVYATDASFQRMERVKENLRRWQLLEQTHLAVHTWGQDSQENLRSEKPAENLTEKPTEKPIKSSIQAIETWPERFDFILADLPCSGSGTLHTRPDILLAPLEKRVDELKPVQLKIIRDLKKHIKNPTGKLVVSVCSVDPIEINNISSELGREADFFTWTQTEKSCEGITAWFV